MSIETTFSKVYDYLNTNLSTAFTAAGLTALKVFTQDDIDLEKDGLFPAAGLTDEGGPLEVVTVGKTRITTEFNFYMVLQETDHKNKARKAVDVFSALIDSDRRLGGAVINATVISWDKPSNQERTMLKIIFETVTYQ